MFKMGRKTFIPRVMQKSGKTEIGALDFNQAKPAPKKLLCKHRGDAGGLKDWDANVGGKGFLDHGSFWVFAYGWR